MDTLRGATQIQPVKGPSHNLQTDIRIFLPEFAKQKRQQKTSDLQRNPKADMIFLPHEII